MKKFSVLVSTLLFISMVSFSQTTKENIERLSRDPQTIENAAKADVYIVKSKKIISDDCSKKDQIVHLHQKPPGRKRSDTTNLCVRCAIPFVSFVNLF